MKVLKVNKSGSITHATGPIHREPVNKDSVYAMTAETDKQVTGIFKNIESPGQPGHICMRLYKGQQPFKQVMNDGHTYTIPLSVARELNKSCKYLRDRHMLDADGSTIKGPDMPIDRYQFIPNSYM